MLIDNDKWVIGETVPLPLDITDANNVRIDADQIRLLIKPPGSAIITITNPTRMSVGKYRHDQPVDKHGDWYYRWEVSAPLPAVAEGTFTVKPSRFRV